MVSQIKQKGFTIVELLIVIVVIAILAAISMAAYTSISARAKDSTAQASAKAVKDVANTYSGNYGSFPTTRDQFKNGKPGVAGEDPAVAKMPADIIFGASAVTYANAATTIQGSTITEKQVLVYPCGTTGIRIFYKQFSSTPSSALYMDAGDCSTAPASTTNSLTGNS